MYGKAVTILATALKNTTLRHITNNRTLSRLSNHLWVLSSTELLFVPEQGTELAGKCSRGKHEWMEGEVSVQDEVVKLLGGKVVLRW